MSLSLLKRLLMKEAVKDTASSSGIMTINKNIAADVDKLLQKYINDARQQGVDLETLSSDQLKMIVQMNKPKPPRVIDADSSEGREITERIFGKQKAPVFDLEGNRIPERSGIMGGKSVKQLMESGQVTKGSRGMKKSKKVEDREMFQKSNLNKTEAQLKKEMDASNKKAVKNIGNKRQLTKDEIAELDEEIGGLEYTNDFDGTVGSANKLRKERKDYIAEMEMEYKKGNLDPEPYSGTSQRKRFLKSKLDEAETSGDARLMSREEREELFDLDDIPDFATGGRAGFKGGGLTPEDYLKVKDMLNHWHDYKSGGGKLSKTQFGIAFFRENNADGGRIGYNNAGLVSEQDGPSLLDMINIKASGTKSGKQQIEGAPEGITSDKETIDAILTMDIPLTEKINLIGNLQYVKDRNKIEYKDNEIFLQDPKSYRDRNIGLDYNRGGEGFSGSATVGDGGPEFFLKYKKSFADGGVAGLLGERTSFGGGGTMGASDKGYQGGGRDKKGNVSGTAPGAAAVGGGADDRSNSQQNQNHREAMRNYQRPPESKIKQAIETGSEVSFLKNLYKMDPMGLGLNIGGKMLYNKFIGNQSSLPTEEEDDTGIMQMADATTTPTEGKLGLNLMDYGTLKNSGYSDGQIEELQLNPKIDTQEIIRDIKGPIFAGADGGPARQNFKMGKRAFLKMLAGAGAGILGLKSGLIGFGGKQATKKAVTETVKSAGSGTPPPYFFKLVEKIKTMGDDVTVGSSTMPRTKVTKYKDYELTENLDGSKQIQKIGKENDMITKDEYMTYTKGQADETTKGKKVADDYEEVTEINSRIYKDNFNDPDYEDGINLKEILEEVGETVTKKADGGRIGFSGGGRGILSILKNLFKPKPKKLENTVEEFLSKRQFMKDIVGNTEKAEKARELRMLKEAADEARKNPGFKFENVDIDKDIRPIFDKEIAESLKKNRKLNATGGLAAMLGE